MRSRALMLPDEEGIAVSYEELQADASYTNPKALAPALT